MRITLLNLAEDGLGPVFRQNKYNVIKYLKKEDLNNPTLCLSTHTARARSHTQTQKYILQAR